MSSFRDKRVLLNFSLPETKCYWHDFLCTNKKKECTTCEHEPPADDKENGRADPIPIIWERSYGDSIFPMCSACGEMPYSVSRCVFCGQRFIKDQRAIEWEKPQKVETGDCSSCGGKGTMRYTKARSNGHMRGYCVSCGMRMIQ